MWCRLSLRRESPESSYYNSSAVFFGTPLPSSYSRHELLNKQKAGKVLEGGLRLFVSGEREKVMSVLPSFLPSFSSPPPSAQEAAKLKTCQMDRRAIFFSSASTLYDGLSSSTHKGRFLALLLLEMGRRVSEKNMRSASRRYGASLVPSYFFFMT